MAFIVELFLIVFSGTVHEVVRVFSLIAHKNVVLNTQHCEVLNLVGRSISVLIVGNWKTGTTE